MPKRLALCFDGTWNAPEDRTNPYRIDKLIAAVGPDGVVQRVHYDEGVGSHWHDWFTGGAFGRGLSQNVREGYAWLVRNYEDGDDVFVFGFSRGAYTARSLVGLVRKCGLLRVTPELEARVGEAYALYRRRHASPDADEAKQFRARHSREIRVKYVGVWDTVGSLGIPFPKIPFSSDYYRFHDTGLSGIVQHAYQALAIDEHRKVFAPTLWTKKPEATSVEQRWFVGAHANVGGGYQRDPLPQIPLRWIQQTAGACGLAMKEQVQPKPDAHLAPVRDSFKEFMYGIYAVARFAQRYHRPIGRTTVNETVDETVLKRRDQDPGYRPPGLERYLAR